LVGLSFASALRGSSHPSTASHVCQQSFTRLRLTRGYRPEIDGTTRWIDEDFRHIKGISAENAATAIEAVRVKCKKRYPWLYMEAIAVQEMADAEA